MQSSALTAAINNAFGHYQHYCHAPTEETLFHMISWLEELDKVLAAEKPNARLAFPEFLTLRALRRHTHSVAYVRHVMRLKNLPGLPVQSDTRKACLVSRGDLHTALLRLPEEERQEVREAFEATLCAWGDVVDAQPTVFNCMVNVFETLRNHSLFGSTTAFQAFKESWEYETENDLPHYVTGPVSRSTYSVEEVELLMTALYGSA